LSARLAFRAVRAALLPELVNVLREGGKISALFYFCLVHFVIGQTKPRAKRGFAVNRAEVAQIGRQCP
jgi:hypothetical protein